MAPAAALAARPPAAAPRGEFPEVPTIPEGDRLTLLAAGR
jgi:hypothetical protein